MRPVLSVPDYGTGATGPCVVLTGATPDGAPSEWGKKNRVYRHGTIRYLVP
jgi:hypothetical protein